METSGRVLTVPLPGDQLSFPGDPYSVAVLRPGYCVPQPDGACRADGTITLITGPRTLLVDTGGPWDRDFLLAALRGRGLEPADVDLVVGTHGHSDHVGNLNLFPSARMIVGYDVSEGDTYLPNKLAEGQVYRVDQHVCFLSLATGGTAAAAPSGHWWYCSSGPSGHWWYRSSAPQWPVVVLQHNPILP